jgi:hypothetical protein
MNYMLRRIHGTFQVFEHFRAHTSITEVIIPTTTNQFTLTLLTYLPVYVSISEVVSYCEVSEPKFYTHLFFSHPLNLLCPYEHWQSNRPNDIKRTNYKALHYCSQSWCFMSYVILVTSHLCLLLSINVFFLQIISWFIFDFMLCLPMM